MGTRELMLARMMADQYAYNAGGYRQRYYHEAAAPQRRFTIRQVGGRLVVEEIV
jgi:hypothetical protein